MHPTCQEKGRSSFQLHEPIFCFFLALVSPDLGKVIFRSSRPGLTWLNCRVRVERSNFQTPFTSQPQEAWVGMQSWALSLKVPSYLLPVPHGPKSSANGEDNSKDPTSTRSRGSLHLKHKTQSQLFSFVFWTETQKGASLHPLLLKDTDTASLVKLRIVSNSWPTCCHGASLLPSQSKLEKLLGKG